MQKFLEQFLGLWADRNGNVLLIKTLEGNNVKVSFASGKTKSPIEQFFLPKRLTIDVDAEYDTNCEELVVLFGVRYFEPTLHLAYEITDLYNGKPNLRPSYKLSASTPNEKRTWMKSFEPLEGYVLIDDQHTMAEILCLYSLS